MPTSSIRSCTHTTAVVHLLLLALAVGCGTGDGNREATVAPETRDSIAKAVTSTGAPALPPPDSVDASVIPPDRVTRARFTATMQFAREHDLAERPVGEAIQVLGERFLGRPYLISPLDQTEDEQLVCRLDGFDCFTFDEAVLAMTRTIVDGTYSYDGYKNYTRQLRYRDGEMGYCHRQHYYTSFVQQAEEEGILRDVTEEIGGRARPGFRYAFMSEHRSEYPQLQSDSLFQCIQQVERHLTRTIDYRYIPQDSISAVYGKLQAGDLIATATDIEGLDVTHTGFVHKSQDGSTGLLHASTQGGVKISPDLQAYVQGVGSQIGIIVARPVFGRRAEADS